MTHAFHAATRRSFALVLTGILCLGSMAAHADPSRDIHAIRHVLMKTFDRPDARLRVDPVVIHQNHAVADWQQGERGGRALMRRTDDGKTWEINLCSGDGLRQAAMLEQAGMAPADAKALAGALARAEARLDKATLARLASFEGTVRMGPHGEHPPVAGHDAHAGHGDPHAHGHHPAASNAAK
ncbi:copper uptake system-associated protein [Leptothrix sp. BB-4]